MSRHGPSGTMGRKTLLLPFLRGLVLASTVGIATGQASRVAISVPVSSGAIGSALPVLDEWPCGTFSIQKSVDLLFYYETTAEENQHAFSDDVDSLARGFGSCLGNLSTMHKDPEKEEIAFPLEVRDAMFNNTFLGSGDVHPELAVDDALAVVHRKHVAITSDRFLEVETEQEPNQEAVWAKGFSSVPNAAIYKSPDSGLVEDVSQTCTRSGLREPFDKAGVGSALEENQGIEAGATLDHGGGGSPTTAVATTIAATTATTATSADPPTPPPTATFHDDHLPRNATGERREQRKRGSQKARRAREGNVRTRKLDHTSRETCEEHEIIEEPDGGDERPDCSRNDKKHTDIRGRGPVKTVQAYSGGRNIGNKWPKQERWREERKYGCLP